LNCTAVLSDDTHNDKIVAKIWVTMDLERDTNEKVESEVKMINSLALPKAG